MIATIHFAMGRAAMTIALALALAASARAAVEVTATGDRVDVTVARVPLSEVLDDLARRTRMKVVYEGAVPRTPVTVDLRGRTPVDAVLGVLDGLGLNYALVLDLTGTKVETLMIVGSAPRAIASTAGAPSVSGRSMRNGRGEAPHANLENPEVDSDEPVSNEPRDVEAVVEIKAEDTAKETAHPAPIGPLNPAVTFPVSPFAPGAAPPPVAAPSPVSAASPSPSQQ